MTQFALSYLLLLLLSLRVAGQSVYVDHVIALYPKLSTASEQYISMGFALKPGTRHANGLINAHIKLSNGSSLELMSIEVSPTDAMAQAYADLLKQGVTGAYLALSGISVNKLLPALQALGIKGEVSTGKAWSYVTFPEEPGLAHIFFIEYHFDRTGEATPEHPNKLDAFAEITLEGATTLISLLRKLQLPEIPPSNGKALAIFSTPTGRLTIVPAKQKRPRIQQVLFKSTAGNETLLVKLE